MLEQIFLTPGTVQDVARGSERNEIPRVQGDRDPGELRVSATPGPPPTANASCISVTTLMSPFERARSEALFPECWDQEITQRQEQVTHSTIHKGCQ